MDYFRQCSCLEINPCPNLELAYLISVRTKKIYEWGVYPRMHKTNIDCSFIRGMLENYFTLGKIQPWPTIHFGPTGLGEK